MRESMAINEAGFWAVHEAYEPGRTQAELMAAAERIFTRLGTGRQTMDMVLSGRAGSAGIPFGSDDGSPDRRPKDPARISRRSTATAAVGILSARRLRRPV